MIPQPYDITRYATLSQRKLWNKECVNLITGNDGEWDGENGLNQPNRLITTQKALSGSEVVILEHPSLGWGLEPTWSGECILSTVFGLKELGRCKPDGYLVEDMMAFFAGTDVMGCQFSDWDLLRHSIMPYITQDARMRVVTNDPKHPDHLPLPIWYQTPWGVLQHVIRVTDLAKLGQTGLTLEGVANSLGVLHGCKSVMDDYKHRMGVAYGSFDEFCNLETCEISVLHNQYMKYAGRDATVLFPMRKAALDRTNMLYEAQGLKHPTKEYLTTGALVNDLGLAYFDKIIGKEKGYRHFVKKTDKGEIKPWDLKDLLHKNSVRHYATQSEDSSQTQALVAGGYAKCDRPTVVKLEGAICDNDIGGAYVTIQMLLSYRIGLPSIYKTSKDNPVGGMNLGACHKKYINFPVTTPGQWGFFVKGKLSFAQNLVYSKMVDTFTICEKYNEDDPKIPAQYRRYSHEIDNGYINQSVWEAIQANATNAELKEWMSLEVITGWWFDPKYECADAAEWNAKIAEHKTKNGNHVEYNLNKHGGNDSSDKKCHAWFRIPLNLYLQVYVDKRKEIKRVISDIKDNVLDTPEVQTCLETLKHNTSKEDLEIVLFLLDAQQNQQKLVGNVNFGDMASPRMSIGSAGLANEITACVRTILWAHNTALGAVQGITDGGGFDLNNVRFWTTKKPGFNTLSLWRDPSWNLNRKTMKDLHTAPIGSDKPWSISKSPKGEGWSLLSNGEKTLELKKGVSNDDAKELAQMIKDHIKHFHREPRRGNGISILNDVNYEVKDVYQMAVFHSQTNYGFWHVWADTSKLIESLKKNLVTIKARGHKVGKPVYGFAKLDDEGKVVKGEFVMGQWGNIIQLMSDLADNPNKIPPYRPQVLPRILKFNQANKMYGSTTNNIVKANKLLPGDTFLTRSWVRPISLSKYNWQTDEQYTSWEKKATKLKELSGWGLEQYFLDEDNCVRFQDAEIAIQRAIDEGKDWIVPVGGRGNKLEPIAIHPYKAEADMLLLLPDDEEYNPSEYQDDFAYPDTED